MSNKSIMAHEWKLTALRDCPLPKDMAHYVTPQQAIDYWRAHVATDSRFNPDCECCVVLTLNTRRRITGHYLTTIGTIDTVLIHPREIYRVAILANASAIILMHNHPSGESSPSEGDILGTHDLQKAGRLLRIELLDHVIVGNCQHTSLRELGLGLFLN